MINIESDLDPCVMCQEFPECSECEHKIERLFPDGDDILVEEE